MQGLLGAIIRTLASTLNELRGHWRAFSREGQFSRVILYVLRVECRWRVACIIVLVASSGQIWIYFKDKLDVLMDWMRVVKVNFRVFGQYH